ncbi:MAG: TIGR03767 family metallophosphoesterase [Nocardioides sp.]|nr:TIGR03767 family metallophosphoesterase [Nocardioides sp.]
MGLSRRALLRATFAAAGAAAVASSSFVRQVGQAAVAAVARSTTRSTYVRGPAGPGGYTPIVVGPGQPRVVRTDLGAMPDPARVGCRQPLVSFAHLSDIHIIDHQSPMRVEWTDRYDDPSELGDIGPGLFSSAHRPQEILSAQVADAMVHAINNARVGPVTGQPLSFAIETGDNSDNGQFNEIRWNIDVLDGERVHPDSGNPSVYEGVMATEPLNYDTHYWHPHGTPKKTLLRTFADDIARSKYGFPTIPGLLDAARRPFQARGLDMEWYSVFGNHDGLAQGNFPHTMKLTLIATGPLKLISPPAGVSQSDVVDAVVSGNLPELLSRVVVLPLARLVTPDLNRRLLTRKQIVDEHFTTSGLPAGHGFTPENRAQGTAYYTFDKGDVRCVVLDTVNPNGYADGSLDPAQFAWLQETVAATTDKAVIVFSHHTSGSMNNPFVATGGDLGLPRVLGDAVVDYLLTQPQVVAWFNGHTHRNEIWSHTRGDGSGGFWEINTASHIDFPQQARLVEIVDNTDGTMSIFTTLLDHAGPASYDGDLGSTLSLAGLSREISANDWQSRTKGYEGVPEDGNVELLVQTPATLAGAACRGQSAAVS